MKVVGEQLQKWAQEKSELSEKDVFGRSAFNRYYYATFLITRETLGDLNPSWLCEKHKNIQNTLVTTVRKPVISELKKLVRQGIINPGEGSVAENNLKIATTELSNLLNQAYDLRCIADYEPEIHVSIDKKKLLLRNYKLNTASGWPGRASAYCKTIRKVWEEAGLASK